MDEKTNTGGICPSFHVNDQARMIPAPSPCPEHLWFSPLLAFLFTMLLQDGRLDFLMSPQQSKPVGSIPGSGLVKILRGREGLWLGDKPDEPVTVWQSWFLRAQQVCEGAAVFRISRRDEETVVRCCEGSIQGKSRKRIRAQAVVLLQSVHFPLHNSVFHPYKRISSLQFSVLP